MKHLAAYLLLNLAGNGAPSAADIKRVLSSVGIDADDERLDKLMAELEGKDIQEVSLLSTNNFTATILIYFNYSSSPRVPRSLLPSPLAAVVVVPLLLPLLLLAVPPLRLPLRRRRRRRSLTRTWALVCSTKRVTPSAGKSEVCWGTEIWSFGFSLESNFAGSFCRLVSSFRLF